ncbi:hypothetical protein G6F57_011244 [Rhizopus arrhizus]|nr:hypothetical protein G6F57_011244 [Rhizopus arrhizus]
MGRRIEGFHAADRQAGMPPALRLHARHDGMAARIARHDWASTALGGIDRWPPHLRATVDLMLAHGFPMIVLWGEQLVQLYNDGYAEILADRHPAGLGQPTRECWPEVWHINGPLYTRVWQGETLTFEDKLYPLARHGRLEDVWFTITYSPIRGEEGRINDVLVTMFETTAAHLARAAREREELRRRESERRLELAFRMLPVGLCIVDLDGRMLLSNDQMRAYLPTGKVPSADADNQHRWRGWHADGSAIGPNDFAIARAMRGETVVPGLEFQYLHDDGRARWTRVAAAPLRDADGEVSGVFAIAVDIDDLKRATERQSVLLAELQRSAAGAETHDLHAKHALIEVTAALDVGNGEDQMVEAVDEDHARSLTLRALPGCAASGRWRCRSRRASPGIHARLSRRCGPSATGQAWR